MGHAMGNAIASRPPSGEFYRQEAARCREIAESAKEPQARVSFAMMAETYDRLAGQVENLQRFAE
jgi:hypothetical protein